MKISLCFLNILLTTFNLVIFIYSALDKIFLNFFFLFFISTFKPPNAHASYCELLWISKRAGKHKQKIDFYKIWNTKMRGSPSNVAAKIKTF